MNIQSFKITDRKTGHTLTLSKWDDSVQYWLAHPTSAIWAFTSEGEWVELNPQRTEREDRR